MPKKFRLSLFIFRRDLRLEDNIGLIKALKNSEAVIPCFIFTQDQFEHNPYFSNHCVKFMIESLLDLDNQLQEKTGKLLLFKGKPEEVVASCVQSLGVQALFVNRDYTPYSIQRDAKLAEICKTFPIPFYSFDDALLNSPEATLKKDGKPYSIFTPFFRNASKEEVPLPEVNQMTNYFCGKIPFSEGEVFLSELLAKHSVSSNLKGGRTAGLKILNNLSAFKSYEQYRDFPSQSGTSQLSPYLKFTVLSPREVYSEVSLHLGPQHELIRALYWRDFFTSIAYFFPHVFQGAFYSKFDKLIWSHDQTQFTLWCKGLTGFPIVDAGMREMNATGFMHNRVRMITASFLIKDLHINWKWGEKYFAQHLIDYDPCVNNGNWQWVASTGTDAQPYFRIFNPWTQQNKFDRDCKYIKQWIPELRDVSSKDIHSWHEVVNRSRYLGYPPPMVIHEQESKKTLNAYRSL